MRRAVPDEHFLIGELTVASYRTLEVDHLWGGYADEIRDVAGRAETTQVLVARDAGTGGPLGAVTYATDPESGWVEWAEPGEAQFRLLAVSESARGRGVGETLVRACCDRAVADDCSVLIHTTQWMPAARRLYERLGFTRRSDRDVPYEEWAHGEIPDLPPVWVGVPFLAYTWSPRR